jgi:hypothetical protein
MTVVYCSPKEVPEWCFQQVLPSAVSVDTIIENRRFEDAAHGLRAREAYHEVNFYGPHPRSFVRLFYLSVASPHTLSNARKPKRFQGYARAGWQQRIQYQ